MKITTKITILLLTLPLAYAAEIIGTVPAISTISNTTILESYITGGPFIGTNAIQTTISNNNTNGWELTAYSENGSKFIHSDLGITDSDNLRYLVACNAITDGGQVIPLTNAKSLGAAENPVIISTIINPTVATVSGNLTCDFSLDVDETVDELLDGTFNDSITLVISNL
jgi:hypothetical protein